MLSPLPTRGKRFLPIAFVLAMLIAKDAGLTTEPTPHSDAYPFLEPNLSPSPELLIDIVKPSSEPELPPMTMSTLVSQSYMRHVDFIRQGLPMALVRSFYNHALKEVASPGCIPTSDAIILGQCTTPLFDENDGYALKSLQEFISEEESRFITERYFPDLAARSGLPDLTDEELATISAAESDTLKNLTVGAEHGWEISVFPTDEEIRFDPGQNASCIELADKMPYSGLTMTASSLTAFVLGMTAQIIFINGDSSQARMILDNHVKLMYLAARCNRASGDKLEVPTQQLNDLIRKAKLALIAGADTSLPPFESVKDVIDGSRHFFGAEIERMSSMNSFGGIDYVTWTGDTVSAEALDRRMAEKTTLQKFEEYYEQRMVSSPEPVSPCQSGFSHQDRLSDFQNEGEQCCAETCIISSGRILNLFIVNEMCCLACNQVSCDLSKLARVVQVEAFRFSRS